eukprot:jgi/Chlat1/8978/Chrsp94S08266
MAATTAAVVAGVAAVGQVSPAGGAGTSRRRAAAPGAGVVRLSKPAALRGSFGGEPQLLTRSACSSSARTSTRRKARISAAAADGDSFLAPVQPESPTGQLLQHLLLTSPHLFDAAVEEQLERLSAEKEATTASSPPAGSSDMVLYKRIAEVRERERMRTIEDVIYALVVQKYIDVNCKLLPSLTKPAESSGTRTIQTDLSGISNLEKVHSVAAAELVKQHMGVILNAPITDAFPNAMAQIPKSKVSQVYTASIMFGYFLRRVDRRYQMEKQIRNATLKGLNDALTGGSPDYDSVSPSTSTPALDAAKESVALREFVQNMNPAMLPRLPIISTQEAANVAERHLRALFGDPPQPKSLEGGMVAIEDNVITISVSALKKVILEAVAFGSFLWDVESFVDVEYGLTPAKA